MSGLEDMRSKEHVSQLGHPQTWSKKEVKFWLNWCVEEYSLSHIPPEKFELNGKALCLLSRVDFMERVPGNGDVLFNCLQSIKTHYAESFMYQQRTATINGLQSVYQRRPLGSIPGRRKIIKIFNITPFNTTTEVAFEHIPACLTVRYWYAGYQDKWRELVEPNSSVTISYRKSNWDPFECSSYRLVGKSNGDDRILVYDWFTSASTNGVTSTNTRPSSKIHIHPVVQIFVYFRSVR